jgi:asparagine synthase (glutamine-hydrolysing)
MYVASFRRAYDDLQQLLNPDYLKYIDTERDLYSIISPFLESDLSHFLDKLMLINIRLKGAHLILPKVERMTAAWGLTAHAPLFDEELVKLSFAMPAGLKLARGIEKIVLKRAYEGDIPAEVIARPKSGMRVPVHYWFQKEMKRYAKKILSRKAVRSVGIFNEKRVQQLLDYDIEGAPGRYGLRLWMLITFEIWRRIVVDGEAV